jgi:hypothetical protein
VHPQPASWKAGRFLGAETTKRQIERPRAAGRACGNWVGKCMAGLGWEHIPAPKTRPQGRGQKAQNASK